MNHQLLLKFFILTAFCVRPSWLLAQEDKDSIIFFLQKSDSAIESRNYKDAAKWANCAYNKDSTNVFVRQRLANAYYRLGDLYRANAQYTFLLKDSQNADPILAEQWLHMLARSGNCFELERWYERLRSRVTMPSNDMVRLAICMYSTERILPATKILESVVRAGRDSTGEACYWLARLNQEKGAVDTAVYYYRLALDKKPNQPQWSYELGLIWFAYNQYEKAVVAMSFAATTPIANQNDFLENYSLALVGAGRHNDALPYLSKLFERVGRPETLLSSIALTLFHARDFKLSIQYNDEVLAQNPRNWEALYMKGMCYRMLGEIDKGKEMIMTAIKNDPSLVRLRAR